MKKADSSTPVRETPEGMHESERVMSNEYPNYPPPALRLEGHVGAETVSYSLYSYTVSTHVIDMFEKHARKTKQPAELALFDTGGSWDRKTWTTLSRTTLSSRK